MPTEKGKTCAKIVRLKSDLATNIVVSAEAKYERMSNMEINIKGTTAEIVVLLNMLEQRPAILDTNKISEEAINEMKDKIPLDQNLLLNIFKTEQSSS